ncbi:MAG: UvrABC system protein A [Firmicutes bacterium ADurb.Bin300]|nr:MAG: UvrABC system protein A [Firmicutes bacterium ADurb.Bin300]
MKTDLIIRGAREHNLKNVNLTIPRDKFIVFTGLSGSGKSSLAFDTIYAEGQRRYIESLSSYARQFLGQMEKPNVDKIDGLSPAISIDQKTTSKNPRSTVGTVTEIYDYIRLLYARIGIPHCPVCGKEIKQQTIDQTVESVMQLPQGTKIRIFAPIIKGRKGEHKKELEAARRGGFVRVRIDSSIYDLSEDIKLDKNIKHSIDILVDRLVIDKSIVSRLTDSLETAFSLTDGTALVAVLDGEELLFSQNYACPEHGACIEELNPRMFSFNNPYGACPKCMGLGIFMRIDPELIIPDKNLSIEKGAVKASGWNIAEGGTIAQMYYKALGERYGFTLKTPIKDIPPDGLDALLFGSNGEKLTMTRTNEYGTGTYYAQFEGLVHNLERRYRETSSEWVKTEIEQMMTVSKCPECDGKRLKPSSLAVTVGGTDISELCDKSIKNTISFFKSLKLSPRDRMIAEQILKETLSRLDFLCSVGLDYLTLSRTAGSISGGENQRIRLATQIGSSLMGVLYILDEPSIGLHQRDNNKLLATLRQMRDLGNTLIVVEHDEETILSADYIVDIGPGAGIHGGEVVCAGTVNDLLNCERSITGQYLSGKRCIPIPEKRRSGNGCFLKVIGAFENNLKHIDVEIPLGMFVAVTGVSGSGKSSLVNEIMYKKLATQLNNAKKTAGKHRAIEGLENLDKVINIDQSPIGRTPRSNCATYTGVYTDIRNLFSQTSDAKLRGYNASRFSFNVKGGRCEACEGDGIVKIEMHFLSDIYVPCEVCKGMRYNRETLEIRYKNKNIYEVLEMTVEEAMSFFGANPRIYNRLKTLWDVGLGYIKLGQPATTLSGGEAQRVKLSTELSKRATGKTIYILDEPTTGLHTADVHRLLQVLQRLVDSGNSAVVIEHNMDVIKSADYIIDLGPEGGDNGGEIIATGTPEQVARCDHSYTGQYLRKQLRN